MDVDGEDLQTLTDRDQVPWGPDRNRNISGSTGGLFGLLATTTTRGQNGILGRNVAVIGHAIRIGKRNSRVHSLSREQGPLAGHSRERES